MKGKVWTDRMGGGMWKERRENRRADKEQIMASEKVNKKKTKKTGPALLLVMKEEQEEGWGERTQGRLSDEIREGRKLGKTKLLDISDQVVNSGNRRQ